MWLQKSKSAANFIIFILNKLNTGIFPLWILLSHGVKVTERSCMNLLQETADCRSSQTNVSLQFEIWCFSSDLWDVAAVMGEGGSCSFKLKESAGQIKLITTISRCFGPLLSSACRSFNDQTCLIFLKMKSCVLWCSVSRWKLSSGISRCW